MTSTDAPSTPSTSSAPGMLAPFRLRLFRAVWFASLASNLGSWMHLVAASWLMTSLTATAALVALLQTANAVPSFVLALPAGAMADVFDRRRLIVVSQAFQLVLAAVLGVVTVLGGSSPALLLSLTFALALGAILGMPAFAAITPELVPTDELPAAISLNATTTTLSQAVGPAVGGLLVATVGPGVVFLVNAGSFLGVLIVIAAWRRVAPVRALPPEHVIGAVRTGLRYTLNAPELRTVLIRAGVYVLAYSALPALLAVIARTRLGLGPGGFGLLLGLLGVGGVLGALGLPRLRRRWSTDRLVAAACGVLVAVLVGTALVPTLPVVAALMVVSGVASMAVLSSLNIAAQQVLPAWVRGRGLAVFMLVFQAGFAVGAALWGVLASSAGIPTALLVAAGVLAVAGMLGIRLRLTAADGVDVASAYRTEPYPPVQVDPEDGPVLITVEYEIDPGDEPALRDALLELRRGRAREGAVDWAMFEDVTRPHVHLETYRVRSWEEHRRQGERRTGADQTVFDRVGALHRGSGSPTTRYLVGHAVHRHRVRARA